MSEDLLCVIEIPKGGRNKYEYDHRLHRIELDRFLYSSIRYPTDYGFLPGTLALDGDPLDVMVCVSEPTFPGCRIRVKAIALLRMRDERGIDDKVLAVPTSDPGWNTLDRLEDVPVQLRREIDHFFRSYKELEPEKRVEIEGWRPREEAEREIEASRARYAERR
jgi:inorganic pyrophosphatase